MHLPKWSQPCVCVCVCVMCLCVCVCVVWAHPPRIHSPSSRLSLPRTQLWRDSMRAPPSDQHTHRPPTNLPQMTRGSGATSPTSTMQSPPTLAAVSFEHLLKEDMRHRTARELSEARAPRQHVHVRIARGAHPKNLALGAGGDPTSQESSDFIISGVTGIYLFLCIFMFSHFKHYSILIFTITNR